MIIILGSTGFIGKSLLNHLTERRIPCLGISSREIDLTNSSSIKKLSKILEPDSILVFASSIVREKGDNLDNCQRNIDMAKNVSLAIQKSPVKRIIYISSIDVYGVPEGIISESTAVNPQTPYGISKIASEFILKTAVKNLKTSLLVLRLGGIFGFGQATKKYGPNSFIESAIKKSEITLYGDGKEIRDLVFIDDLVRIISYFSLNKNAGIVNVASGQSISFISIAKSLKKIFKKVQITRKPRTGLKANFVFENSLLKKNLPKSFSFTSIEEALKITVDSYKNSD